LWEGASFTGLVTDTMRLLRAVSRFSNHPDQRLHFSSHSAPFGFVPTIF
jgi:hypothetical protein